MESNREHTIKHIGFITPEYPHAKVKHAAGIGTSVKNLALALVKEGIKVTIFVYSQNKSVTLKEDGVNVHLISHIRYRFFGWYFYRKHINRYVNTIVKKESISLIEAPDWTGFTAFMSFKVPLVIRLHGSDTYFCHLEKRPQKWKNHFLEKKAINKSNACIAPTKFAGDLTQQLFNIKPDKIKTIHHGILLNKFTNNNPSCFTPNTILYLGTIIRKKGVLELASIFNKVLETKPDAKLVMVGGDSGDIKTGSKSTFILFKKRLSSEALKHITYLGKVPYAEVQNHIKNAHVCVFPSYAETLGMVTIESMALQKAIVNTDIGWAKSLIDDSINGFLVHPSKHEVYASKIVELLDDIPKCIAIGKEARLKVNNEFNIDVQVKKNIEFYRELIG